MRVKRDGYPGDSGGKNASGDQNESASLEVVGDREVCQTHGSKDENKETKLCKHNGVTKRDAFRPSESFNERSANWHRAYTRSRPL